MQGHASQMQAPDTIVMSDESFGVISDLLLNEAGIVLPPSKRPMIVSRLSRRLRALNMTGFPQYCDLLQGSKAASEMPHLVSALTTNTTRFYREPHHFDDFKAVILPPLIERARKGGRVRFWSAGCSSGEEPYSMGFDILEACPEANRLDIRILATDIDHNVLARATAGRYPKEVVKGMPDEVVRKYMNTPPDDPRQIEIDQKVRDLIAFKRLNLMHDWPFSGPFDAIFCRNVVIYFDPETQAKLWPRFAEKLCDRGRMYIGHSERITGQATSMFSARGQTYYERVNGTDDTDTATSNAANGRN